MRRYPRTGILNRALHILGQLHLLGLSAVSIITGLGLLQA